jgi:hypothetical protein
MPLTIKLGAAVIATAAASVIGGAALGPAGSPPALHSAPTVNRAAKADRLDAANRPSDQRLACLAQDWLRLSSDCAELFMREAQRSERPRSTTIVLRERGGSVIIPVPRPESE